MLVNDKYNSFVLIDEKIHHVRDFKDNLSIDEGNYTEVEIDGDNAYIIRSAEDLNYMSYLSRNGETFENKSIKLNKNIDMAGYKWIPLVDFKGQIIGNDCTISNLYLEADKDSLYSANGDNLYKYLGFIASATGENVLIKDVIFEHVTINTYTNYFYSSSHPNSPSRNDYRVAVGALIGYYSTSNAQTSDFINIENVTLNNSDINVFASALSQYADT
ncbi:MAG: hypothetical protein IJW28_00535, partial [Clostridia bacterium]|nr:hypothetical protein [Clostridia bacterium]